MFLGLIGVPAPIYTPEAFSALRAGGTALGAAAEAASQAAIGGILAQGAAVVGAGALGFLVGQQVLKNLEYTGAEPSVGQTYKASDSSGFIRVRSHWKQFNAPQQDFENDVPSPLIAPYSRIVGDRVPDYGYLAGTPPQFVPLFSAARDLIEVPLTVDSVSKVNGQPVESLRKVPGYPLITPATPFKLPTTIPIAPGIDPYPITPEIVPYAPPTDPDREQSRAPGIAVKIPELGLEFDFTPGGVTIRAYTAPDTKPTEAPDVPPPKGGKTTTPPDCCEPPKDKRIDEIICRVETLQDDILNDGYTYNSTFLAPSQSIKSDNVGDEFYSIGVLLTQAPLNASAQRYPEPAPNVIHSGWYAWSYGGTPGDRCPIQFNASVYLAPQGADGFVVALNDGFLGVVEVRTRVKKDYIDVCDGFVLN